MVMTSVISDIRPSTIPCPSMSTPFRHFAILALLLAPLEILQPHLLCGHGLWLPLFSIFWRLYHFSSSFWHGLLPDTGIA